jgi:hypothetical protein
MIVRRIVKTVADRQRIPLRWGANAGTESLVKLMVESQVITQVDTAPHKAEKSMRIKILF